MPAAIAVPLITGAVGAATTVVGAKKASDAAKDAAKTQSQAADRAMAAQQAGYQQQRQDFSPYLAAGTAALGRLGTTAGTYTGGPPVQQQPGPLPQQGAPQSMNLGQLGMGQPPMMNGGGPPPMAGAPQGGPMVRVQAPDGEIRALPQALAQQAVAKGARLI